MDKKGNKKVDHVSDQLFHWQHETIIKIIFRLVV